jgi:hypothetical protein
MKIFFLLFLIYSAAAFSQESRWIDIEWEEVPSAINYEVELYEGEGEKLTPRGRYKVETPSWSNAVAPGKYSLRIRSLDKRGVPGEWSDYIPVKVRLHNPKLFQPGQSAQVKDPQVDFEWSDIEGAAIYQLIVKNDKDKILHNTTVKDVRTTLYLEELGTYSWTVYALEEGEPQRSEDDLIPSHFRTFVRVGGELESPHVNVTVGDKITIEWQKVREAKQYELDYLPPVNSDKSRRFKLTGSSFAFPPARLREGLTTISIKSTAPGYPDSVKTIVQLLKSGKSVEIQDIIQPKKEDPSRVSPASLSWKNEIYASMLLAKYNYSSTDVAKDTKLEQKELTGLGMSFEWLNKPKLNSLQRKTELSYLQLSSGRESGMKVRGAFSLSKDKNLGNGKISYGGGLTYLLLPSFMGDRFEDDINVEQSSSIGPHVQVNYSRALSTYWGWQAGAVYSQQLLYLNSERDGGKMYPWMSLNSRFLYFITKKEALFLGVEYQKWSQKWSGDQSDLAGFTLSLGLKAGF